MARPLPRVFYERPTKEVARDLLGKILIHRSSEGLVSGLVVETEAYLGENDPGSHASTRKTPRNSVMFETAGVAYVYFTYGMHYCFNAVAKPRGQAGAVLIRALQPLDGISIMARRREREDILELASGPGKLTQALGIEKSHNGTDLTGDVLFFSEGSSPPNPIKVTSRIGLSKGQDLPLRFHFADNSFISRP